MKSAELLNSLWIAGTVYVLIAQPVKTQVTQVTDVRLNPTPSGIEGSHQLSDVVPNSLATQKNTAAPPLLPIKEMPRLSDLERPLSSVKGLLVQETVPTAAGESQVVEVRGVRLNPKPTGIEVILETPDAKSLQANRNSDRNTFIADINRAQLRLPSGKTFRQDNPVPGITSVTVTNQDANSIRVTVTGETGVPTVELFSRDGGLIFGVTLAESGTAVDESPDAVELESETEPDETSTEDDEQIDILVTGEQDSGYSVPDATTGTRTDTPIRDIPQSIQVIPREVIQDRQVGASKRVSRQRQRSPTTAGLWWTIFSGLYCSRF